MLISFILPFYHKARWFRAVLPVNDVLRSPEVEVVCVLDEPDEEKAVLDIVRANPDIKFKVIVNDWHHPWRPPCIAFNVGVRHAAASHIVLASPESIIQIPSQNYLQKLLAENWRDSRVGMVWNIGDACDEDDPSLIRSKLFKAEASNPPSGLCMGFLMCQKVVYEQICGMNEGHLRYGRDDDEIRMRLIRYGIRMIVDPNIRIFHPWHPNDTDRSGNTEGTPHVVLRDQAETWGMAFNRVAFDWSKR